MFTHIGCMHHTWKDGVLGNPTEYVFGQLFTHNPLQVPLIVWFLIRLVTIFLLSTLCVIHYCLYKVHGPRVVVVAVTTGPMEQCTNIPMW